MENTYPDILSQWNELITYSGFQNELSQVDEYYLDIATNHMMEVLGHYVMKLPNIDANLVNDPAIMDALHVCDFWEGKLQNETGEYSVVFRNKLAVKKSHVFYTIDDNQTALNLLANIQTWGNEYGIAHANYWTCQINQIEALKSSNHDVNLLLSQPTCEYDPDPSILSKRDRDPVGHDVTMDETLILSPNPAKEQFVVTFGVNEEGSASISLLDLSGKLIKDFGEMETHLGLNKAKFSTREIRAGVYFVKLKTDRESQLKKLILID